MGVPKFFRYISERYPCLSELVKEYQIPEFDNLYLDMNGIIHMCSHPNDFDPHFRITEERIFKDIFHYLEILFQMIKPRKLFFMAIDGVAPRAKMNQQRGRRFRSAKEAEVLEKKAKSKGESLPKEARFDSNCITPGTVFMARLHEQLKYFVTNKMSNDPQWKGVKVILSGHETPGEGEHKIMEYIRWMRAQPGYDTNTRHCLYGLDADLMMLGLCTHEPHFSLLREEVKFGKQSKRISVPEETRFYLLHLSIMREYLDLEFQSLKAKLNFPYDLESIIDDWVLMGFLVGNDFIPHLPHVHISSGALPMLYNVYIEVLPTLEGYINEKGYLKLDRFQKFMEKLGAFDINQFKESYADMKYFESKTNRKMGTKFDSSHRNGDECTSASKTGNSELDALIKATNEMVLEKFFDEEDDDAAEADEEEDDVDVFASRIYDEDSDSDMPDTFRWEFHQHKKDYYRNKLEYGKVTEQVLKDQAEGYVRAIQWNLHYYYHGVASWSWYYPHHYAPYISDICNFKDVTLNFELGEPFKPFEQLLAVLPSASKSLLPAPYRELMIEESSPILDYYPQEFQTDLNGKQQEWEAVVLIPFIDEERLLLAMSPCEKKLSDDEKKRNEFGPMLEYSFSTQSLGEYNAPEYFPMVKNNHAHVKKIWREDLNLHESEIVHGLLPDVRLDVYFPGFPTFHHLPYSGALMKAKVQVFDQASRGDNMILTLLNVKDIASLTLKMAADRYLGKTVYCCWPHLSEGKVVGVADCSKRYNYLPSGKVALETLSNNLSVQWESTRKAVANEYMRRLGVDIGITNLIVYVNHVVGRKYVYGNSGKITLDKQYSDIQDPYALQTVVDDITVHDPTFLQFKTLEEVFPPGSKCFLLAPPVYGSMGEVIEVKKKEGRLFIKISTNGEPDVEYVRHNQHSLRSQFMPGSKAAQHIGISSHFLSRITGTIYLVIGNKQAENPSKINIGLNLKFNKKNEEIPGYTRKDNNMWLYSRKAVSLIKEYVEKFPEVFEHLSRQTSNDFYDDKDIYPGDDCADKVAELAKWLKEIPSAKLDRQSCGAEILDEEVVAQIQAVVKSFADNPPQTKKLTLQVKPHIVYKSALRVGNMAPDKDTTFQLFDRVVNVREDSMVPLGLKGTIIGIHPAQKAADTMYDILFDQEFPSGMSLAGTKGNSYRVSRTALINISYGCRQGFIHENYRNPQSSMQTNSAFAKWSEQGKGGVNQASNMRVPPSNKSRGKDQSTHKKPSDSANRPAGFKFPAPPNVQILSRDTPHSTEVSRSQLWDQLQAPPKEQILSRDTAEVSGSHSQNQHQINKPLWFGPGTNLDKSAHVRPPPPTALPIPSENMTNLVDTKTTVLKMMLGVAATSTGKEMQNIDSTVSDPRAQAMGGQSVRRDSCSVLLQFYERKGAGIPVYSVATAGADVIAQVKLPDGTVVNGKPASSKQEAAENAAVQALQLLGISQGSGYETSNARPSLHSTFQTQPQPSGQLSGQPQQFFEQFRQVQFPPPPRPVMPTGNTGWQQSPSIRQPLVRQGPPPIPPFPQAVQHHQIYQQSNPKHQFGQPPAHSTFVFQNQKHYQRPNNHFRRGESDGSNHRAVKQSPQQQQHHNHQNQRQRKNISNDPNSFVPLQAMKKQRNARKTVHHEPTESKPQAHASTAPADAASSTSRAKVENAIDESNMKPSGKVAVSHSLETATAGKETENSSTQDESRSVSRMKKSRLAITFKNSSDDA